MNSPTRRHAARVALAAGLALGAGAVLAASTPGDAPAVDTNPGHGVQVAQAGGTPAAAPDFAAMVAAGDAAAGQTVSLRCAGCHSFGEGEAARIGPNLYGVVGRPVASSAGFSYSPALAAVGAGGATWTVEFLNAFVTAPADAVPGTTMRFVGIPDEAMRANLIAYLATLSGAVAPAADAAPAGIPVTYSTAQADRGQSRYTRECVDCHGSDLNGGLIGGPPLRGLAFGAKYLSGQPASAMYAFMSTTMPPDNPGRFSAAVYAEIMAYILEVNGFPPGADLPADLETLATMTVQK